MKKIVLGLFVMMVTFSLSAANYYASPNGTGDGSSVSTPGSISAGFSVLASVDTLYLMAGQYDLTTCIKVKNINGTAEKYKVISGYTDGEAILDYRWQAYGERGINIQNTCSYIHLKNLTIRYTGKNALLQEGSNCIVERIVAYGNGDTGIQHKNGRNNLIKNCDSYCNFDYKTGDGTTSVNFGGNADGFADKQYSGGGNVYEGCRAWDNSDDGWDFYEHVTTTESPTIFRNCICYKIGPVSYDVTKNPRSQAADKAWFESKYNTQVTDRYGKKQTITAENFPNLGNGNGFKVGGNYTSHNVVMYNCLSVGCSVFGFDQNNNAGKMEIYNCSAYDNKSGNYGFRGNVSGSSLIIKNSLSLLSGGSDLFSIPTLETEYNSWNIQDISCTIADFASLDSTQILAPRQVDGSLANTMFMQLAEGSDLIDAGTILSLPYSGLAPDLGCYELGDLTNYPGAVSTPTNAVQNLVVGMDIEPISLKWSGGATGLEVFDLPEGLSYFVDEETKTLVISGAIVTPGIYTITVQTVGATGNPAVTTLSFVVKSSTAKRIAYLTTSTSGDKSDKKILEELNNCFDFNVSIFDITQSTSSTADYTTFDLVVMAPAPSSKSAGIKVVEGQAVPMLVLKPFVFKSGIWDWGTAVNTTDLSINITNATHAIFKNFSSVTSIPLFDIENNTANSITGTTHNTWAGNVSVLATASSNSATDVIVEVPVGTEIGGVTIQKPFLSIGVSEYSTTKLSALGTQLIKDACYYLMGMEIPLGVENEIVSSKKSSFKKYWKDNQIVVCNDEDCVDMMGRIIK